MVLLKGAVQNNLINLSGLCLLNAGLDCLFNAFLFRVRLICSFYTGLLHSLTLLPLV